MLRATSMAFAARRGCSAGNAAWVSLRAAAAVPHSWPCSLVAASRLSSTSAAGKRGTSAFRAPQNVGPGRPGESETANPFKSWEHLSHNWLILMCIGCLCAGVLAGHFVEVDESKIKPKFSKGAVIEAAAKQFEFRPDLAATSIRVAFVLAARRAGFPAETLDESCAVSEGLVDVAGVLNYLGTTFGASMEDAVALAAIAGIKYLDGPYDEILEAWQWGRNDTDEAPARNIPQDPAQKVFSMPTILHGLGDLTDEECVALMACHSVGEYHENVSGLDGATHIGTRYRLSNAYYSFLLEHEKRKFTAVEVERTEDNKDVKVLPTTLVSTYVDVKPRKGAEQSREEGKATKTKGKKRRCVFSKAEMELMLRSKTWRPIVERFAKDEAAWSAAFQSAFTKMINGNFRKLRPYSEPDAK